MRTLMLCLGAVLAGVSAHAAPGDVFLMQIPNINGDVTRTHYTGWITVSAFSAGITTPVSTGTGGGGAGRPTCNPLVVIKPLDTTSPELAMAAATGEHLATVNLAALGSGEQREFLRFTLKNAIVTSIVFGGDSVSSAHTETLSIIAEQIQITATPQLANGQAGTPVTTSFSCTANIIT